MAASLRDALDGYFFSTDIKCLRHKIPWRRNLVKKCADFTHPDRCNLGKKLDTLLLIPRGMKRGQLFTHPVRDETLDANRGMLWVDINFFFLPMLNASGIKIPWRCNLVKKIC